MNKIKMIIFNLLALSSALMLFNSCQEDVLEVPSINLDLPVVKSITASSSTVLIETSIEVSVTADNASSYAWTAPGGTFTDPSSSATTWTAPSLDEGTTYKLQCTVTNSKGSTYATVSVRVATVLVPEGATAYWSFDSDLNEDVSGTAPTGGSAVSISSDSHSGTGAALFAGDEVSLDGALFYKDLDLAMGFDDDFTIALWMKSEDEASGFIFGRSFDGEYVEGSKGLYYDWDGPLVFDVSWITDFYGENDPVTDGEWHHVAVVKEGLAVTIYMDGEVAVSGETDDWSDDEGTVVTIGGAQEEPGGDWPGIFQGLMDDVTFYPTALSAEEIAALASGG